MGKPVRSARGQLVDFDLLKIKQQIAAAPKPTNVQVREDFIDPRLRRRIKKLTQPTGTVDPQPIDDSEFDQPEDESTE